MKILRPRKWTEQSEALFHEHAGKIADDDLASMLNTCEKWIRRIRRQYKIPKFTVRKYTDEQIDYIRANYRNRSVREMIEELSKLYPDVNFKQKGIEDRMRREGLIRTPEEVKAVLQRETEIGTYKNIGKKLSISQRIRHVGDVFWSNAYQQWLIVLPDYSFKFYKVYVWEQHNPKLQNSHYIRIKDPSKPITIDNLEMLKKDCSIYAKELTDNWVITTMMHKKDESMREVYKNNPILIEQQRLKIQVIREIKALINDTDRKLEDPPQGNERPLLPG